MNTMRRLGCGAVVLTGLMLVAHDASANQVTLGSGKVVELLSAGPMTFANGGKALVLQYSAKAPMNDLSQLRLEVDEIWDQFVINVDQGGYTQAIIMAKGPEDGGVVKHSQSYNFIYTKKNGSWRTLEGSKDAPLKLDDKTARDFVKRVDWLIVHKEFHAGLLYMADDWTVTLPTPNGPVTLDRDQFVENAVAATKAVQDYHHHRDIQNVTIAPDGMSAQVDSVETETGTLQGRVLNEHELSSDRIEIRGSNLLWVKSHTDEMK